MLRHVKSLYHIYPFFLQTYLIDHIDHNRSTFLWKDVYTKNIIVMIMFCLLTSYVINISKLCCQGRKVNVLCQVYYMVVFFFNCPKCTFYFSGSYSLHSMDANGHVVYKHETNLVSFYLHYTVDSEYNWSGWQFTRDIHDIFGFISNDNDDTCPHGAKKSPWRCFMKNSIFTKLFSFAFIF